MVIKEKKEIEGENVLLEKKLFQLTKDTDGGKIKIPLIYIIIISVSVVIFIFLMFLFLNYYHKEKAREIIRMRILGGNTGKGSIR